jgi:hypothetical protein
MAQINDTKNCLTCGGMLFDGEAHLCPEVESLPAAATQSSKEPVPDYIADYDIFLPMDEWERRNGPMDEYLRKNPNPCADKEGTE